MRAYLRTALCLALALAAPAAARAAGDGKERARDRQGTVYMFGVALDPVDSVAYVTDLQRVEGVSLDRKTRFLLDRQLYSIQLQVKAEELAPGSRFVPAVFFGQSKARMEKKYLRVRRRVAESKEHTLRPLDQGQFLFKAEEYIAPDIIEDPDGADKPVGKKGKKSR